MKKEQNLVIQQIRSVFIVDFAIYSFSTNWMKRQEIRGEENVRQNGKQNGKKRIPIRRRGGGEGYFEGRNPSSKRGMNIYAIFT